MSDVSYETGNLSHVMNFYLGPMNLSNRSPLISMILPHKYLDYANESIRLGEYADYLWARQERLLYKARKWKSEI